MNTDFKHYLYFSISQAGKIAGSVLATAILARFLDPSGLGRWTMLIATATFFHSIFANWIQQDAFLRFGKQEWVETGALRQTWAYRLPLLTGGFLISAIVLLAFNTPLHLTRLDALLILGYLLSLIISIDLQTILQITGRLDRMALAPMLITLACVPLYFGLWMIRPTAYRVEISLLGTILLTLGIWLAVAGKDLWTTRWGFSQWSTSQLKAFLLFSWPILPTALLGYAMNWGNQVLIHRTFSNQEVGLYQAAFQVHTLGITLALPFTTILMPKLIDRHLQDPTAMYRFAQTIAPTLFCLWLLIVIPGIAILPWVFTRIYGSTFSPALLPLTALLAGTPFCALGQIYTGLYTAQGRRDIVFGVIFAMATANYLGAWVFVPESRITLRTIALAFSAAFILAQFLFYFLQHRLLKASNPHMHGLFAITLAFAAGECMLSSVSLRAAWSALILVCLITLIRRWAIVDAPLLKTLFAGRLEMSGKLLERLLIL